MLSKGTRFDNNNITYHNRYWNQEYFTAIEIIKIACEKENLSMSDCSIRWYLYLFIYFNQ